MVPWELWGSMSAWLKAGFLFPLPKMGNGSKCEDFCSHLWLNTNLAPFIHYLSLNYNLVSLLAMCPTMEALSHCKVGHITAAPSW